MPHLPDNAAPDGGVYTTLVNPAEPARVATGKHRSATMADLQKVPGSSPRRRRRRNPSGTMNMLIKILLPAAAGGAIGYLESDPVENAWWHKIDDGIKAVVLAALAYVAERSNQPHAAGAASAFAGFYAARKGLAYMAEKDKAAGPNKGAAGRGFALKGLMDNQNLTPSQVDNALAAAIQHAERSAPQGGGVAGISYEGSPADMNLAGVPSFALV